MKLSRSLVYKLFAVLCLLSAACAGDKDPGQPAPPVAIDATDITGTSFTATWNKSERATGYQLDISTDDFKTFVTGYNSKSLTATTETVTGLTAGTTYKYRVRASDGKGISANSNEVAVTTSFGTIATINGAQFAPTELKLTDTNIGLELHMKDGVNDITLRLADKVAGTYDLESTVPTGRTQAMKTAIAWWVNGNETYYSLSGSVTVVIAPDGKISLTFNATGATKSGKRSTIANGKLPNATATAGRVSQCSLATYGIAIGQQQLSGAFGYDSEGRLIQFLSDQADQSMWNFIWTGSQITRVVVFSQYEIRDETWTYENNVVTRVKGAYSILFGGFNNDATYDATYTYTGNKLTKAVKNQVFNGIPYTYTHVITYNADNISTITSTSSVIGIVESDTYTYSNYDNKNNHWQLMVKATNNPLPIGFEDTVDGSFLGKNNVGKISTPGSFGPETQTYTYTAYSAAGYPTSLKYASSGLNYSAALSYMGCN